MTMFQVLPILGYAGCIGAILMIAVGRSTTAGSQWLIPAATGAVFFIFTLVTLAQDGLIQFWVNHTTDFAGNQVWFDLIIAVTIGFYLIAPRAKAVGMPLLPWSVAVFATACIALLPMLARVLWLEQKSAH
ncbi:hypothetical protein C7964_10256 [Loktanella sp. PT4BL]|jgi:hypothetical protein|uniref:hypothetical protein n=1 Tax=Loktanella sp. PT4BL TaxID=2135611 RepID=UPI000D7687E5|nr:hypothetical protein [Loktanella sp. PT4BL]PXW70173.1 hypothetical protein C7964_10256 [Loktanella sp. PT4BL]